MSSIRDPRLPALGIDAGSRTIKMVLFDGRGMCASMVVENGYAALERVRKRRGRRSALRNLPLNAILQIIVERHLRDHRFDQDLARDNVQPLDHAEYALVVAIVGHDQQRVLGVVGNNLERRLDRPCR